MISNYFKNKSLVLIVSSLLTLFLMSAFLPTFMVYAADYVPLATIPGTTIATSAGTNLSTYLTGIFKVGVVMAGVLAFLMIVLGGFQYLSTDAITGKEEGKTRIERALGGLILALASYIILYTINPDLVSLNLNFGQPLGAKSGLGAPQFSEAEEYGQRLDQYLKDIKDANLKPEVLAARAARGEENNLYTEIRALNQYISELDPDKDAAEISSLTRVRDELVTQQGIFRSKTGAATVVSLTEEIKHAQDRGEVFAKEGDTGQADVTINALREFSAKKILALKTNGLITEAAQLQTKVDDAIKAIEYRKRCPSDTTIVVSRTFGVPATTIPCK